MILPEFLNDAGESASNPLSSQTESTSGIVRSIQAKIIWSSDTFIISSWSHLKAFSRSPYINGFRMSRIPSRQYAISSTLVVCLSLCRPGHRCATLACLRSSPSRSLAGMPVILDMMDDRPCLVPILVQSLAKKTTSDGPMSSWRVQPRVQHLLAEKDFDADGSSLGGTSLDTQWTFQLFGTSEHRVDSLRKFGAVRFVDATLVIPEVLHALASRLLPAKSDLLQARSCRCRVSGL
jgi:hypothetical protein